MLVSNTEERLSLVMLEEPPSGWAAGRIRDSAAMPAIPSENDRIVAVAKQWSCTRQKCQKGTTAKIIGYEAIQALGPMDYCGVGLNDFGGVRNGRGQQQMPGRPTKGCRVGKMVPGTCQI